MSSPIISVSSIGKKYRLGFTHSHDTLRDKITSVIKFCVPGLKDNSRKNKSQMKAYSKEFWALKDISFDVKQGEVLGIIGPNGAGKTTLLKILSQITEPTEGEIHIKGRVASLLEVGTGFHPELSGRENVYMNGAILGMTKSEIKAKFDKIVAFAEVEKFIDTPVKRYSSGMQVRLAFAVAAHLEPEILVVDEVLAVGDIAFQQKCMGIMGKVALEGRTVLFVSHNLAAIEKLCSRCILLNDGRLKNDGTVKEIITEYRSIVFKSNGSDETKFPVENKSYGLSITSANSHISKSNNEDVDLEIQVNIYCKRELNNIGLGLGIKTLDGNLVCHFPPTVSGNIISLHAGKHRVTFQISKINKFLTGGKYTVEIFINRPRIEQIINLPNAVFFIIEPEDPYSGGVYREYQNFGCVPLMFNMKTKRIA